MEQGRIILAVALSFVIFLVYDLFFVQRPVPEPAPDGVVAEGGTETQAPAPSTAPIPAPVPAASPAPSEAALSAADARTIQVETPLYIAELREEGAVFTSFKLKRYRETVEPASPMKEILSLDPPYGNFKLIGEGGQLPDLERAVFSADVEETRVGVDSGTRSIRFRWRSSDGVQIEKVFGFSADTYTVDMTVEVSNGGSAPLPTPYSVALYQPTHEGGARYAFIGPCGFIDNGLVQIEEKKIPKTEPLSGQVSWIGQADQYFLRALVPQQPVAGVMKLRVIDETAIESRLVPGDAAVPAGQVRKDAYVLFMGPKSLDLLGRVGHDLNKAVNFGMFDFLAKPLLWIMNQIYRFIPNYGVAIIILTILTKILLWPLGQKSYKSMAEMRKLQPLMTEIREKHKNDKKKMNEEMMGLYRTYKINPMGGCLPMVVQIPFFFALYRMLYEAIELRHAPFVGWINDLSAPDRLLEFGFAIPFMQPPYGIPVLTIVMGATMFLQQKMSPAPGDPTQAKMMMFMPIIFTVIFINFSSGLVLYWLVNNILSIGQQYMIQRKYA